VPSSTPESSSAWNIRIHGTKVACSMHFCYRVNLGC
jgi:hypothetical protein